MGLFPSNGVAPPGVKEPSMGVALLKPLKPGVAPENMPDAKGVASSPPYMFTAPPIAASAPVPCSWSRLYGIAASSLDGSTNRSTSPEPTCASWPSITFSVTPLSMSY